MPKARIQVFKGFHKNSMDLLNQNDFEVETCDRFAENSKADVLVIRSFDQINDKTLPDPQKPKLIVSVTSGFDQIDIDFIKKNKIIACYTPDGNQMATAEFTWALVLTCAKKLSPLNQFTLNGKWRDDFKSTTELHGKTYGVIGLGRIGSEVAKRAGAFGMTVLYYDPYVKDSEIASEVNLQTLLERSHVISLHVPLTEKTLYLLNHSQFKSMKKQPIIINTSRGKVIQESALIQALESGQIQGAGLDVFESEPLPMNSPLRTQKNLFITPHFAARTTEAHEKKCHQAALTIIEFFHKNKVVNSITECPWL